MFSLISIYSLWVEEAFELNHFSTHQGGNLEEELLLLEQQVRRNDAEMEEEEFWQNEMQIEQDSERQLRQQLAELQGHVRDCEAKLSEYLARIQVRSYLIPLDFIGFINSMNTFSILSCLDLLPQML